MKHRELDSSKTKCILMKQHKAFETQGEEKVRVKIHKRISKKKISSDECYARNLLLKKKKKKRKLYIKSRNQ